MALQAAQSSRFPFRRGLVAALIILAATLLPAICRGETPRSMKQEPAPAVLAAVMPII